MMKKLPPAGTWFLKRFSLGLGAFVVIQALLIGGGVPLALHLYGLNQTDILAQEAARVLQDGSYQVSHEILAAGPFLVFNMDGHLVYTNRGQGRSLDPSSLTPVYVLKQQKGWVYTGETAFLARESNKRFLLALVLVFVGSLGVSVFIGLTWSRSTSGKLTGFLSNLRDDLYTVSQKNPVPIRPAPFSELSEITKNLEALGVSLSESDLRQRQFLQDVAHDLRTPLSGLRAQLEALGDGVLTPEPSRFRAMLSQTDGLVDMINDLSLLFRTQTMERLRLEELNSQDILGALASRFELELRQKGVTLDLAGEPCRVIADKSLLERALGNIVENALRHGIGMTVLRMGCRLEGKESKIWIQDNGPGVGEKDLGQIFLRYWRGDPGRATPGSGLGLSIVDSIIRRHKGTVQACRGPDGGLRIEISLPVWAVN